MKDYDVVEILIVEDNPADAELTIRALRKNNLVNQIHVVENGEAALDYIFNRNQNSDQIFEHQLKVVFLDLKLPKINGLEVLSAIKSDPKTKSIPVVILTSSKENPDIKAAYELGANSYIVKPVDFDDFINAMSQTGLYWLLVNKIPKNN
jgi:two-component system response regulator